MTHPKSLDGRAAIVTGTTAESIGRACAVAMAEAGAKLIVTGRTEKGGLETEKRIRDMGGDAIYVRQDVTLAEDWRRVVDACLDAYGRLDILLNNAGESKGGALETLTHDHLKFLLGVNVDAIFLGCKTAWPHLKASGHGVILNMSSLVGQQAGPGGTIYSASKAAQTTLTKSIALEAARDGIRAISVHPGLTWTDGVLDVMGTNVDSYKDKIASRVWMGEWVTARAIGDACVFLASDAARYITGVEFNVDGGGVGQMPKHAQ